MMGIFADHISPADLLKAVEEQMKEKPYVVREFEAKAELFKERAELYGDNYKRFGFVIYHLFPNGIEFNSQNVKEMNRLGVFIQVVSKLTRYAENWKTGHNDSLDDLVVYAMMLKELDND